MATTQYYRPIALTMSVDSSSTQIKTVIVLFFFSAQMVAIHDAEHCCVCIYFCVRFVVVPVASRC